MFVVITTALTGKLIAGPDGRWLSPSGRSGYATLPSSI